VRAPSRLVHAIAPLHPSHPPNHPFTATHPLTATPRLGAGTPSLHSSARCPRRQLPRRPIALGGPYLEILQRSSTIEGHRALKELVPTKCRSSRDEGHALVLAANTRWGRAQKQAGRRQHILNRALRHAHLSVCGMGAALNEVCLCARCAPPPSLCLFRLCRKEWVAQTLGSGRGFCSQRKVVGGEEWPGCLRACVRVCAPPFAFTLTEVAAYGAVPPMPLSPLQHELQVKANGTPTPPNTPCCHMCKSSMSPLNSQPLITRPAR